MPHTQEIMPGGRYAVVSCHVERPLDDAVWRAFSDLQERRPSGFRIAALIRPPDPAAGEDEQEWVARASEAAERGLLGPFFGPVVHAYFHDTDLLDAKRRRALRFGLAFLGAKRSQTDLDQLRNFRPTKTMSFANSRG